MWRPGPKNSCVIFIWSDSWAPQLTFQSSGQEDLWIHVLGNLGSKHSMLRLQEPLWLRTPSLVSCTLSSAGFQCLRAGELCLLRSFPVDINLWGVYQIYPAQGIKYGMLSLTTCSIVLRGHLSSCCKNQVSLGVSTWGLPKRLPALQDT